MLHQVVARTRLQDSGNASLCIAHAAMQVQRQFKKHSTAHTGKEAGQNHKEKWRRGKKRILSVVPLTLHSIPDGKMTYTALKMLHKTASHCIYTMQVREAHLHQIGRTDYTILPFSYENTLQYTASFNKLQCQIQLHKEAMCSCTSCDVIVKCVHTGITAAPVLSFCVSPPTPNAG